MTFSIESSFKRLNNIIYYYLLLNNTILYYIFYKKLIKPFVSFSKFCGYEVCSDHSRKKRPDPKNKSNFVTICDRCDYQHLYRVIFEEYDKRKLEKEAKINGLEAQLMELKDILVKKQNELAEMKKEKLKRDEEYADAAEGLTKKIRVLQNEIKKIELETNELNKNYTQVNDSIKEIDKSLIDVQAEYNKLYFFFFIQIFFIVLNFFPQAARK